MTLRSAGGSQLPPGDGRRLPGADPWPPGGDSAAPAGLVGRRILVVDDHPRVQAMTGRALQAHGCVVDTAGTLAEARRLDPGGYDVVVVDARLDGDDGMDLVGELAAADPAAASRCLIITGASLGILPGGVAVLAKPFEMAELVSAVSGVLTRATQASGPPGPPAPHAPPRPRPPAAAPMAAASPPASGPATSGPATSGPAPTHPAGPAGSRPLDVLAMTSLCRASEQAGLAGFLHDQLVQDLAAASLELELLRRAVPAEAAGRIDTALGLLRSVSQAARQLIDDYEPMPWAAAQLAAAVTRRTRWLFAEPVTVDDSGWPVPVDPGEVPVIAGAAELLLYCLRPGDQPARARVTVWAQDGSALLDLAVTASDAGGPPMSDPHAARELLLAAAAALGAVAETALGAMHWRAAVRLPRPAGEAAGWLRDQPGQLLGGVP
ncbi:MAG TPA: response regulator [Streptosporangiaceae bacterium]